MESAVTILTKHAVEHHRLAKALLEYETLTGEVSTMTSLTPLL